ncbi:MAG: hypothetical protein GX638_17265, partial [Crenarchaeota archaeon]|nr:hypothetical protein [Thermoproteota archaeon]
MSMHLKQKEEKILQVLEALENKSAQGVPIIVEGQKDLVTLRDFNI